jgi:pyruvate carboxylase
VTHFYDPLLAKLIVDAEDPISAIQRMQAALKEFIVHGVVTNIDFLQAVLSHPDFANGKVTTRWVETKFNWNPPTDSSFESLIAASLADLTIENRQSKIENEIDPYSPWKSASGFRN